MEERVARNPFLHNIVHGGSCAIILLSGNNIPPGSTKLNQICQGLLVQLTGSENENHTLLAHTKTHIILSSLPPKQTLLYSTVERLARKLRSSPFTLALSQLITTGADQDSNSEYTTAVEGLKTQTQEEATAALENFVGLADAMQNVLGDFWRLVAEWYYHGFEGSWVGED